MFERLLVKEQYELTFEVPGLNVKTLELLDRYEVEVNELYGEVGIAYKMIEETPEHIELIAPASTVQQLVSVAKRVFDELRLKPKMSRETITK